MEPLRKQLTFIPNSLLNGNNFLLYVIKQSFSIKTPGWLHFYYFVRRQNLEQNTEELSEVSGLCLKVNYLLWAVSVTPRDNFTEGLTEETRSKAEEKNSSLLQIRQGNLGSGKPVKLA